MLTWINRLQRICDALGGPMSLAVYYAECGECRKTRGKTEQDEDIEDVIEWVCRHGNCRFTFLHCGHEPFVTGRRREVHQDPADRANSQTDPCALQQPDVSNVGAGNHGPKGDGERKCPRRDCYHAINEGLLCRPSLFRAVRECFGNRQLFCGTHTLDSIKADLVEARRNEGRKA